MIFPSFYNLHDIEKIRKKVRLDPQYLKHWRNAICKHGLETETALSFLPTNEQKEKFRSIEYHPLTLQTRLDSQNDGATKLLFITHDKLPVESVILRIQSGRTSLCLSSQVGCAMKCQFCATGGFGFKRNLTTEEILDQVAQTLAILRKENRKIRNIVFMGMGEPFANTEHLYEALDCLRSPQWFEISDRHITVSTVGIIPKMLEWGTRYPNMSFALSLHSARQEIREQLIPTAQKYSLIELKKTCQTITQNTSRYILLEYLMLQDLTDTSEDIEALTQWCQDLPIHLNIIRYNRGNNSTNLISSSDQRIQEFADIMRQHVEKVTFRCSLGDDIMSACGQLAGKTI